MHRRTTAIAVLALLALVACGDKSKVGDQSLLNFKDKANQERLGQTTTTAAATATTVAGQKASIGASTTTSTTNAAAAAAQRQAQQQAQQQAIQAATIQVAINGDGQGYQFDPSAVRVYKGSFVKWVNHDTVARSVESDDGKSFVSPSIPPGGSWTYTASTPGQFAYHDGTRPYAVATLEVINR
jgi:plastocyanin